MTALNDLKQALSDLQSTVSKLNDNVQARIDAAVAAKVAEDHAAFDEAIGDIRAMTSSLADQTNVVHQTAAAIAPRDLPPADPTAAGAAPAAGETVPAVQTTQTASTDPTGTAAVGAIPGNIPDGAMSTAAPGAAVDPATAAPIAQTPASIAPAPDVVAVQPAPDAEVPPAATATDPAEPAGQTTETETRNEDGSAKA